MSSAEYQESLAIYRSLISLSLLLTFVTVVLSAYIRLAEVGIGCDDWPACYGQLDTATEKKGITVLTAQGREMAHYGARVAHRYIASTLGLFIVAITVVALRQGQARATGPLVPLAVFSITVFLSLLGYYTPSRSNPLITMGNLLGGMSLLGLLWWMMQREAGSGAAPKNGPALRPLALGALGLVLTQIILGGWSSANFASASCPGLLQCEGKILVARNALNVFDPSRDIPLGEDGQVIRAGALGILSMVHRLFALLSAAYLAWMVRRLRAEPLLMGTALVLSVLSVGQLALGVATVWLGIPLPLLTLHNAMAAGLLLGCVNLLHRLTPAAGSGPPG